MYMLTTRGESQKFSSDKHTLFLSADAVQTSSNNLALSKRYDLTRYVYPN